jgi:hypothetical protein
MIDFFQIALQSFNGGNWYGVKNSNAPMNYENIKIIKDGATMPTEAEVNAKIQELKDAEANAITKKASGKQKLLDLGLSEEEVKALIGV